MIKTKPQLGTVTANEQLDEMGLYFRLTVEGYQASRDILPGQFAHIKTAPSLDPYFRRAFSIAGYDAEHGRMEFIYRVFGRGTTLLAKLTPGDKVDFIAPLGRGFSLPGRDQTIVMIAGGVGFPPLYYLAAYLIANGYNPRKILFFYGGRTRGDLVDIQRIRNLNVDFYPCTDDGSYGFHGLVTESASMHTISLDADMTMIYSCGPEPMLREVQDFVLQVNMSGEVSLEAPMPCGIGVCLGCIKRSLRFPGTYVRVCHDGPVFPIGEVEI